MRHTMILAAVLIGFIGLGSPADAQCKQPNLVLTGPSSITLGKTLVLNYWSTERHLNGEYVHTFLGLMPGKTPLGNGYCLALGGPIYYLGCSPIGGQKSSFKYQIPNEAGLIGANLFFAGFTANSSNGKHGASNNIRTTIWEDWPLP